MYKISIFASSKDNIDQVYKDNAVQLGQLLGGIGNIKLITGGGNVGLMKAVTEGFLDTGNIRNYLGIPVKGFEEETTKTPSVLVASIGDRYDLYFNNVNMIICLPGGVGTIGELFTAISNKILFKCKYKIFVYDPQGSFILTIQDLLDNLLVLNTIEDEEFIIPVYSLREIYEYLKIELNEAVI